MGAAGLAGGQRDGGHQATTSASAFVLQRAAGSSHRQVLQGGAHQQLMRGWLLHEPVPPGNGGEEQRWREQRGPCTRHTEEDKQLIPIDVLLAREQQPASALGWEGRNGSQEGREQASR